MNGAQVSDSAFLPTIPDTSWDIATTVDADPDGKTDLIWFQWWSGKTLIWRMDGFTVVNAAFLPTMGNFLVAPRQWTLCLRGWWPAARRSSI